MDIFRRPETLDILVENSPENIERLRKALAYIPEGEADRIEDTDLTEYRVVRVSGEITVDVLAEGCEVTYSMAEDQIVYDEIQGVRVPYLQPQLLMRTKMGVRPKDAQDRAFLQRLIARGGNHVE